MMCLSITGNPPSSAQQGTIVAIQGTAPDCEGITFSIENNGVSVPGAFSCEEGKWVLKFTMPSYGTPPNIVSITLKRGSCVAAHDMFITP